MVMSWDIPLGATCKGAGCEPRPVWTPAFPPWSCTSQGLSLGLCIIPASEEAKGERWKEAGMS
jgi:hypothetical protein